MGYSRETYAMPLDIQCFLMGNGPLEGVWFGEKHPTREGNFWWRDVVRERITVTRTTPSADDALYSAGLALYEAGLWELRGGSILSHEQAVMWERLRDALGLDAGHSTALASKDRP